MNALVLRLELRRSRVLLFWLSLTAVLYAGFIAAYYPIVAADTELVETMIKNFPKAMIAAFGIEGNLADQGTYLNVYVLSFVWPMLVAVGAILIPTRTVAADLERGFLELPLTTAVSRLHYLLSAIGAQLVVLMALVVTTVLAIVGMLRRSRSRRSCWRRSPPGPTIVPKSLIDRVAMRPRPVDDDPIMTGRRPRASWLCDPPGLPPVAHPRGRGGASGSSRSGGLRPVRVQGSTVKSGASQEEEGP